MGNGFVIPCHINLTEVITKFSLTLVTEPLVRQKCVKFCLN